MDLLNNVQLAGDNQSGGRMQNPVQVSHSSSYSRHPDISLQRVHPIPRSLPVLKAECLPCMFVHLCNAYRPFLLGTTFRHHSEAHSRDIRKRVSEASKGLMKAVSGSEVVPWRWRRNLQDMFARCRKSSKIPRRLKSCLYCVTLPGKFNSADVSRHPLTSRDT